METIIIYKNSDVAKIAANIPCCKFSELQKLAKKEVVEMVFRDDYCRITAKNSRKVKLPKKVTLSGDELLKWIEHKIKTAWK